MVRENRLSEDAVRNLSLAGSVASIVSLVVTFILIFTPWYSLQSEYVKGLITGSGLFLALALAFAVLMLRRSIASDPPFPNKRYTLELKKFYGSCDPNSCIKDTGKTFFFGNIETNVDIYVWDDKQGILPSEITLKSSSNDDSMLLLWAKENMPPTYRLGQMNNGVVSLSKINRKLIENESRSILEITYNELDYNIFSFTLDSIRNNNIRLQDYYPSIRNGDGFVQIDYGVPNAMGLAFMVTTSDGYLVLSRRNSDRAIRGGQLDCSIVEGLKPINENYTTTNTDYIEQEIKRSIREEVGELDSIDITICGIAYDREYGQWNIIGVINTESTHESICHRHPHREDGVEDNTLYCVSMYRKGKKSLIPLKGELSHESEIWGMSLIALYAALRKSGFTDADIEENF